MKCPNCNSNVSSNDKFCKNCGNSTSINIEDESGVVAYLCPVCKTPNPKTVNYCVKCGHWLLDTKAEAKPITKNEFSKYFYGSDNKSKPKRIAYWFVLVFLIGSYIKGSADIKMILSILVGFAGLISILKPLNFLGIKSRPKGLGVLLFGILLLFISASFLPSTYSTITSEKPININEYKDNSVLIPYDDLARQTEQYVGKKVKYIGQVIQVQEEFGNKIFLRVNITKGNYNIYKDMIWINYMYKEKENRILENDIINVWGEVKGRKSYSTVLGNKVTLPEINGVVIEIVGK